MLDEFEGLVQNRRESEHAIAFGREDIKYWIWLGRGLVIAAVAVALFYARTEYKLSEIDKTLEVHQKAFDEREAVLDKFSGYIINNNTVNQGVTNTVENVRDRINKLDDWKAIVDKEHKEMWFMKEHGISNKDDFFQKHGYAPPEGPFTRDKNP